jgi:hypothetical protein
MKTALGLSILAVLAIGSIGCDDDDEVWDPVPATPQGVYSITGDEEVYVYWNGIYEHDVREYLIYRSLDPVKDYELRGTVDAVDNPNLDLLIYEYIDWGNDVVNGTTYYYAVAAVDFAGQMSELSAENVFDTPRPEGATTLFPNNIDASLSGFNLETGSPVYDTSRAADIWIDFLVFAPADTVYYINVANGQTDIQDMGHTSGFDEISYSPDTGWSDLGYFELLFEHTYVIWTADDHYAKMRVTSFNPSGSVSFQWAYQTAVSNPELALPVDPQRPEHGPDYPGSKKEMLLLK